jgi:hypothetical protein
VASSATQPLVLPAPPGALQQGKPPPACPGPLPRNVQPNPAGVLAARACLPRRLLLAAASAPRLFWFGGDCGRSPSALRFCLCVLPPSSPRVAAASCHVLPSCRVLPHVYRNSVCAWLVILYGCVTCRSGYAQGRQFAPGQRWRVCGRALTRGSGALTWRQRMQRPLCLCTSLRSERPSITTFLLIDLIFKAVIRSFCAPANTSATARSSLSCNSATSILREAVIHWQIIVRGRTLLPEASDSSSAVCVVRLRSCGAAPERWCACRAPQLGRAPGASICRDQRVREPAVCACEGGGWRAAHPLPPRLAPAAAIAWRSCHRC